MNWLFNLVIFFSASFFSTQLQPYLKQAGYDSMERAWFFALAALLCMIFQLILSRYLMSKFRLSILQYWLAAGLLCTAYELPDTAHVFLLCIMLFVFSRTLMNVNETWLLQGDAYGRMRSFGAFGMSIGAVFAGFFFQNQQTIYQFLIIIVFTMLLLMPIKDDQKDITQTTSCAQSHRRYEYILFLAMMFLLYGIGSADQYLVIDKMMDLGATQNQIAWKWALQSGMEIPFYLCCDKLFQRFTPYQLMKTAIVFFGIRFFCYSIAQTPLQIILSASFQLVTMPMMMASSKYIIKDLFDGQGGTQKQMQAMAIFMGLSMMVSPLLCGWAQNYFPINLILFICALLCIFASALHSILEKRINKT